MGTTRSEKSIDVPPTGDRNADPITDAPGSHPVETGIGAAVAGAATGAAMGSFAGPLGTAVGTAIGAVAGGYAGKGVGEMIDPTTEDPWLRDNYKRMPYVEEGDTFDTHVPAYRYGAQAEAQYGDESYSDIEDELKGGWDSSQGLTWTRASDAVKDGYERSRTIRRQRSGN